MSPETRESVRGVGSDYLLPLEVGLIISRKSTPLGLENSVTERFIGSRAKRYSMHRKSLSGSFMYSRGI